MIDITLSHTLVYGSLSLALITIWLPKTKGFLQAWHIMFLVSLGLALVYGYVQPIALLSISVFGLVCYWTGSEQYNLPIRTIAGILMLALCAGFFLHIIPGFSNPKVVDAVVITEGAIPYSKYLNFDKATIGLFVLGFTIPLLSARPGWKVMTKQAAPIAVCTITVILVLSFAMGYVRFEPKWTNLFWFWAWTNLLFTCVAEEAVFRGIIQKHLVSGLTKYRYGAIAGLVIASVIFGLAHFGGGLNYVLLSTAAGLGYGWVYLRTGRIEASILTHFLLNTVHFVFFTYPALVRG